MGFGAGDSNLYRYVGNNPLDYVDPSGNLATVECALVRQMQSVVNIVCPVVKMALDGSLASQDIDKQVENAFQLMNVAFSVLPFGSSLALQTTLRAITVVQTSQALASLDVNQHLFSLLEVAETYVLQSYAIYQRGAVATFQEAVQAFTQSDNRGLLLTRFVCGAANMGLMVLSASARCFVAGTPVVVGYLPPEEQTAADAVHGFGVTTIDVLAGLAIASAIVPQRRRRSRRIASFESIDEFFEDFGSEDEPSPASTAKRTAQNVAQSPASRAYEPSAVECSAAIAVASLRGEQSSRFKRNPSADAVGKRAPRREEKPAPGRRPSVMAMLACIVLAATCLLPRFSVSGGALRVAVDAPAVSLPVDESAPRSMRRAVTQAIEEIRCGQRVVAELPPGITATEEPEPEAATWRLIEVELTAADGQRVEVHLLRPRSWLEQAGTLSATGEFPLRLEELGIEGKAAVLRIAPCPPIASGAGQVVTGTFRHTSDQLIDLHLVGDEPAITCTSGHPIWSEDRHDFVSASALRSGEAVRLHSRALSRVDFQRPHPGSASVFNLEVNRHHIYHVGPNGLLVHNSGVDCDDDDESSASTRPREIPYRDIARPSYNNGKIQMDHEDAKVWGNTKPATRPLPAETNMRRGGFDGKLYREYLDLIRRFVEAGHGPKDARRIAREAVQSEIEALRNSPPPRSLDPRRLYELPTNPMDQRYP